MAAAVASWVGRGGVLVVLLGSVSIASAAQVLFPEPRHFVRRVDDPVAGRVATIHEYCAGNQIVSIDGDAVVVTDYAKQQVLEIDRKSATFSITSFDDIARAEASLPSHAAPRVEWTREDRGLQRWDESARTLETVVTTSADVRIELALDRRVALSRSAAEALAGAGYPHRRTAQHDALLGAARVRDGRLDAASNATSGSARHATTGDADSASERYALPVEQRITMSIGGDEIVVRDSIVAVTDERVADSLLLIPPGARQVESRLTRLARELSEIERRTAPSLP